MLIFLVGMDVSIRVSLMWEEVPRENPHVQLGDEDTHSHKTKSRGSTYWSHNEKRVNCPHHFLDNPTV